MQDFENLIKHTPWAFQGVLDDKESLRQALASRPQRSSDAPYFSLITPLWNTPPLFLEDAIGSCLLQTCPDWELILVDDGSTSREHLDTARRFVALDKRIQLHEQDQNGGISWARNKALNFALGKYIAILDHDDLLHPFILAHYKQILERDDLDLLFCNEVKIDSSGRKLSEFFYKPQYDRQTLLRTNYLAHFTAVKAQRIEELKATHGEVFNSLFDGVEDHQYFLRLGELPHFKAKHSPVFGYYWRKSPTSTAGDLSAKPYVRTRLCTMLKEFAKPGTTVEWAIGKRLPVWTYQNPDPIRLDIHVWGVNPTGCIDHLQKQTRVEFGRITQSTEERYYPHNLHSSLIPRQNTAFILIIHASTRLQSNNDLHQLLAFLSNSPECTSVSPYIADKKGLDRGDWSLAQTAYGRERSPMLRSFSLESDFSGEQRLGLLPSPLCTVLSITQSSDTQGLQEILAPHFFQHQHSPNGNHFYLGSVEARFECHTLPIPNLLSPLAFGDFTPQSLTALEGRQMSYDPHNRWIHSSQIAADWLEVPLRYRWVDSVNRKLKLWLAPLHRLIKSKV